MTVRVAFIGLGAMGEPMAAQLAGKGHAVTVVGHRRREPVERVVALGAREAGSLVEAARDADVVVTMLPGSDQVDRTCGGPQGVLAAMREGATLLDCSTSDPARSRALAQAAASRGIGWVDAPVTRGVQGAREGKLAFFIGGESEHVARVQPLLDAMGDTFLPMGPAGSGHATKLLVQSLSYATVALVNESLMLGSAVGLQPQQLQQALLAGAGSKALEAFGPRIAQRQYAPARVTVGDACAHMELAQRMAEGAGCARGGHAAAQQVLALLVGRGLAGSDIAAMAELWPAQPASRIA